MSSTVTTASGMEISSSTESAAEMLETLAPKAEGKGPRALVDRGRPVKQEPEKEGLAKAASELGKAGGEAAAKARKEANPEPKAAPKEPEAKAKPEPKADEKPENEEKPAEHKAKEGDPRFDAKARIAEVTRQRHEAERRAAMLEARLREYEARERPGDPDAEPTREQFQSDDEFVEARVEYRIRVREREREMRREVEARAAKLSERITAFRKSVQEDAEFVNRVDPALLDLKPAYLAAPGEAIGPAEVLGEALTTSEVSRELFYYLTDHPDEVRRLLQSENGIELRAAVGRIEGRLLAERDIAKPEPEAEPEPEPEREPVKPLPPPFKPLRASSAGGEGDYTGEMSFDEYRRRKGSK